MKSLKNKKKQLYIIKQIKQQEIKALKRAAKYRREFLGNVSHELKTPIFNIQGYIHTLIDECNDRVCQITIPAYCGMIMMLAWDDLKLNKWLYKESYTKRRMLKSELESI